MGNESVGFGGVTVSGPDTEKSPGALPSHSRKTRSGFGGSAPIEAAIAARTQVRVKLRRRIGRERHKRAFKATSEGDNPWRISAKKSTATELWYDIYHKLHSLGMTLNLFTDYSLRVLMYAALPDRERFSLDEVSDAYGISRDHVAKVVQCLVHAGYLSSQRGRGGGISLARPASEIRVGDIVRDTDGQKPFVECFNPKTNTCRLIGRCRLQGVLGEALRAFQAVLDSYTLADLVSKPAPLSKILAA